MEYSQINLKRKKQIQHQEARVQKTLVQLTHQLEDRLLLADNYRQKNQWQQFGFTMYKAGQIGYQIEILKKKYKLQGATGLQISVAKLNIEERKP